MSTETLPGLVPVKADVVAQADGVADPFVGPGA